MLHEFLGNQKAQFNLRVQRLSQDTMAFDMAFKIIKFILPYCGETVPKGMVNGTNNYGEIRKYNLVFTLGSPEIRAILEQFRDTELGKGNVEVLKHVFLDNPKKDGGAVLQAIPSLRKGVAAPLDLGARSAFGGLPLPAINVTDVDFVHVSLVPDAIEILDEMKTCTVVGLDMEWDMDEATRAESPPGVIQICFQRGSGKFAAVTFDMLALKSGGCRQQPSMDTIAQILSRCRHQ